MRVTNICYLVFKKVLDAHLSQYQLKKVINLETFEDDLFVDIRKLQEELPNSTIQCSKKTYVKIDGAPITRTYQVILLKYSFCRGSHHLVPLIVVRYHNWAPDPSFAREELPPATGQFAARTSLCNSSNCGTNRSVPKFQSGAAMTSQDKSRVDSPQPKFIVYKVTSAQSVKNSSSSHLNIKGKANGEGFWILSGGWGAVSELNFYEEKCFKHESY